LKKHLSFPVAFLLLNITACATTGGHGPYISELDDEEDDLICQNAPPIGSRISRVSCMSQHEIEAKQQETQEILEDLFPYHLSKR